MDLIKQLSASSQSQCTSASVRRGALTFLSPITSLRFLPPPANHVATTTVVSKNTTTAFVYAYKASLQIIRTNYNCTMSHDNNNNSNSNNYDDDSSKPSLRPERPIVIADVLDTLVRDPFFNGMASYFNFDSMDQFMQAKAPGVWIQFEKGLITESQLAQQFFKDGRPVDIQQLKTFLKQSYQLLPGVDHMLNHLRHANIQVHTCTNYPIWAQLIEQSIGLNAKFGVKWSFISAIYGIRKPDPQVYQKVAELAGVRLSSCIFVDDRDVNCHAASETGMHAIKFTTAQDCQHQLEHILSKYHNITVDFSKRIDELDTET